MKTSLLTAPVLFSLLLTSALPVSAETLDEALAAALSHHPAAEAAQAGAMATGDQIDESKSNYFPELSANASGGRIYGDNATSRGLSVERGAGYSYLWEGNVAVTQRIFDGFETQERVQAAKARHKSSEANIIDVRENLALQTVQAYLNVMRTQQVLKLIEEQNAKIGDYLSRIDDMVTQGAADAAELKQAEDIRLLLSNLSKDYETQHRGAIAQYRETTGHAPEGAMSLPPLDSSVLPVSIEDALKRLDGHPALQAASYETEAGAHDVKVEKAALYPDVNGELSYLERDQRDVIGGEVVDGRAVVKMSWNFSTGGAQFARIRQKQGAFFESRANQENLERQLALGLEQAWAEYEISAELFANAQERETINEDLMGTYNTQFEGAQIRLLQLMQGENQLFQVRLERMNALYRHQLAGFSLLARTGQLQSTLGVQVDAADDKQGEAYETARDITALKEAPQGNTEGSD